MTQSTMMVARLPLLAALMAWQGAAAPSADRVDALPGWDGALPSQWWSGYVLSLIHISEPTRPY